MVNKEITVITDGSGNKEHAITMVSKGTFTHVHIVQAPKMPAIEVPFSFQSALRIIEEKLSRLVFVYEEEKENLFFVTIQKYFFLEKGWNLGAVAYVQCPRGVIIPGYARSVPLPTELSNAMIDDIEKRYAYFAQLFPTQKNQPMFDVFVPGESEIDWFKELLRPIFKKIEREKLY